MGELGDCAVCDGVCDGVRISPVDVVRRRIVCWTGIKIDSIQIIRHEQFEYRYKAPCHLLIMSERAERDGGETLVEGLPKSTLHQFNQKLTLVPAGHEFCGWQVPLTLTRVTYFYIDPHLLLMDARLRLVETELRPRLFFSNNDLWGTLQKLKGQAENPDGMHQGYAEALSVVLAHELFRLNNGVLPTRQSERGGLAGWQKKRVVEYVEEHLSEDVLLSTLADVAGLSAFHFARAFKKTFGLPPHVSIPIPTAKTRKHPEAHRHRRQNEFFTVSLAHYCHLYE
jgi:AraC family transcriptional regulator